MSSVIKAGAAAADALSVSAAAAAAAAAASCSSATATFFFAALDTAAGKQMTSDSNEIKSALARGLESLVKNQDRKR